MLLISKRCGLLSLAYLSAQTRALKASISSEDGYSLTFSHGDVVVQNSFLAGRSAGQLAPVNVKAQKQGRLVTEDGDHITWSNINDHEVRVFAKYAEVKPVGAALAFPPDDLFYGVWEYPWNGSIINNNHSYADIGIYGEQPGISYSNARAPFFFTKSGFGVYLDTPEYGVFEFQPGQAKFTFNASTLTYSVMYNTNLTALLMQFAAMSNKIEMPPESGYGPIFWSDNFEEDFHAGVGNAQDNFNDVVNHLYYNQIRATGMVADRPYGTGNNSFGNFDFDTKFYPNVEEFVANLSSYGLDLQVWVANRAFLNTQLYGTASQNNWLMSGINHSEYQGPAVNLSIAEAYDYFYQKLGYFARLGIKGFKIDRGDEREMPDAEQNKQMSLFQDLCYRAMSAVWGDGNFYSFSRSAFDRARSKTAIWNGDSSADFTGLRYSVASGIKAGLLGFSQWGSDTGGFRRSNSTPTEEVFARWMHFSAFSPMYEIMIGTNHTPWYDYSPQLVSILKKTADLHTRLIPYIRSYTYQATQTGLPVMRALFLEYPNDTAVYNISDAYSFGKELLVAPIVSEGGSRSVYFPQGGSQFLEYLSKAQVFSPGQTHNITALPLDAIPVYVREGSIVVTGDIYQGNAKWVTSRWAPRINIEIFHSFKVPQSMFVYYRGKEGNETPGPATITLVTDQTSRSLTVQYDDLGVDGTLSIYHKSATNNATLVQTVNLPPGGRGQILNIGGLRSVFE